MFKSTVKIIQNQGETLMKLGNENDELKIKNAALNRKCLNLQGQVDDLIDDLKEVRNRLTINDYGKPEIKIAKALEFIKDKIKELDNAGNID